MKIHSLNVNPPVHTQHTQHAQMVSAAKVSAGNKIEQNQGIKTSTTGSDQMPRIEADQTFEDDNGVVVDVAAPIEESKEDEVLAKSVDQANQSLKLYDRKLELAVHEVTKTVMYTLRDTKTNEVIMEFPPKKVQDMIAKMWELAGLFIDKRA